MLLKIYASTESEEGNEHNCSDLAAIYWKSNESNEGTKIW